jgi:hypothetical protein
MVSNTEKLEGGGPWQFENPELAPGESWELVFRNMTYAKTKGYFKKWIPFDFARFVNESGVSLSVTINGIYDTTATANTITAWDKQGITRIRVTNLASSTATVKAGNFTVETQKEPYGADKAAREQKGSSWLESAANDIIPGGLPGDN